MLQITPHVIRLLTLKRAEDGRGHIVRLWNPAPEIRRARVSLPKLTIGRVVRCNVVETDADEPVEHDRGSFTAELGPRAIMSFRVLSGS